jgi:hypothetical protein
MDRRRACELHLLFGKGIAIHRQDVSARCIVSCIQKEKVEAPNVLNSAGSSMLLDAAFPFASATIWTEACALASVTGFCGLAMDVSLKDAGITKYSIS